MEIFNVEITLFNIIGYGLLLGSALTVLLPVVVWIGNAVCACLWEFIDEGDTDYVHKGTSLYLITYCAGKVEPYADFWLIKLNGYILDRDDLKFWTERYTTPGFKTRKEAASFLTENYAEIVRRNRERNVGFTTSFKRRALLTPILAALGTGFLLIPTTTLFSGAAILSLYSMRWARRGVKIAKKVKSSLDSHISDKNAHKE